MKPCALRQRPSTPKQARSAQVARAALVSRMLSSRSTSRLPGARPRRWLRQAYRGLARSSFSPTCSRLLPSAWTDMRVVVGRFLTFGIGEITRGYSAIHRRENRRQYLCSQPDAEQYIWRVMDRVAGNAATADGDYSVRRYGLIEAFSSNQVTRYPSTTCSVCDCRRRQPCRRHRLARDDCWRTIDERHCSILTPFYVLRAISVNSLKLNHGCRPSITSQR